MSEVTHIALLRGINVSGQKLIKMADLRDALSAIRELSEVETYIQSGNIVLNAGKLSDSKVEQLIHEAIKKGLDFDVPVLARSPQHFARALKKNPFSKELKENPKQVYFTFLEDKADTVGAKELENLEFPEEFVRVVEDVVYFYSPNPIGRAKFSNKLVEKKLKMSATTRNYRTLVKLLQMSGIEV